MTNGFNDQMLNPEFSDHELNKLFRQNLQPAPMPADMQQQIKLRLMAEVSSTFAPDALVQLEQSMPAPRQVAPIYQEKIGFVQRILNALPKLDLGPKLALAGTATFAAAFALIYITSTLSPQIPKISVATNTAITINGAIKTVDVDTGFQIEEGDTLKVDGFAELDSGKEWDATLSSADIEIAQIDEEGKADHLVLNNGQAFITVKKSTGESNSDSDFEIETDVAVARAEEGASFIISSDVETGSTYIAVESGTVTVDLEDGQSIKVSAGQELEVSGNQNSQPHDIADSNMFDSFRNEAAATPTSIPVDNDIGSSSSTDSKVTVSPTKRPTRQATSTGTPKPKPTATKKATSPPRPTNENSPATTVNATSGEEDDIKGREINSEATKATTPTNTSVPTNTPSKTPTKTPIPPTVSSTPVPPTATNTSVPPTTTPTFTVIPPTQTPLPPTVTNTPVPPTVTLTLTAVPQPTATNTPVPPPTATNTPVPPPTATNTPVPPPTATNTPVPTNTPTKTATNTPVPPPTATNTPVPPPTATDTPIPPPTATNTSIPSPTAADTPVPPPTATDTSAPSPLATPTNGGTSLLPPTPEPPPPPGPNEPTAQADSPPTSEPDTGDEDESDDGGGTSGE